MKEELQGKLVEILGAIQSAAGKASDFAMEQLPDIALSYVMYGRAIYTTGLIVGLLVLLAGGYVFIRHGILNTSAVVKKPGSIFDGDWLAVRVVSTLAGGAGVFLGALLTGVQGVQAAMVWFAPKVWLLKEIAGMLK